jgi:hypothetical protein
MALSRFQIRLLRWISAIERRVIPHERFGDVTVLCATSDEATRATLFKQVKLALGLLKLRAPAWFRRVQTEIATVSLIELGPAVGLARFELNTRDCVVNTTRLLAHPEWAVADIALALVHEATHGWLFRHGVRPSTAEEVQRVERVCNRAEACLVARIPEVPLLAKIVAVKLTMIPEAYSDLVRAKRGRAYYWALIRGAIGVRPS